MRTAFEIARTGRPGPVVIDVPKDVQNWQGRRSRAPDSSRYAVTGSACRTLNDCKLDEQAAASFFGMLGRAERPLIYAGGGVIHGKAPRATAPARESSSAAGRDDADGHRRIDTSASALDAHARHARHGLRQLRGRRLRLPDRARCALRRPRRGRAGDRFARNAKWIAHLDVDASEIGKVKRVQWSHVGLLLRGSGLAAHAHAGRRVSERDWSGWHRHLDELRRTHAMNYDRASPLIQPYYVIEELNRRTRGEAIITTGVGQHQMWAAQYFDFKEPRLWLTSGSMGTMGFGLPAAIGAQFARRDRLVIDVDGDASVRMNIGELETVTTYDLPIKVAGDEQPRRRHGQAVAEALLQGAHVGERQVAAQEGLRRGRAGGRLPLRRAAGAQGRRAARGRGVHRFPGSGVPRGDHRSATPASIRWSAPARATRR